MVRDLFEFGRERSVGQAIGFYLVYLVAGSILVVAATALLGTIGDQPGQAALMVTRPAEGSRRVSDERATVVAYANGTTRVTVRGDSGHDTRVEIAPDGSATVVSGGSSIVSRSADATTITVNDV